MMRTIDGSGAVGRRMLNLGRRSESAGNGKSRSLSGKAMNSPTGRLGACGARVTCFSTARDHGHGPGAARRRSGFVARCGCMTSLVPCEEAATVRPASSFVPACWHGSQWQSRQDGPHWKQGIDQQAIAASESIAACNQSEAESRREENSPTTACSGPAGAGR